MRKLIVIVALISACSSAPATTNTPPPPPAAGTPIGAGGGTVTSADGHAVLTFPAGALSSPVGITATPMTDAPASSELVPSRAYDFGPSGTQFNQPVTITLGYDPAQLPDGLMPLFLRLYLRDGAGWDLVAGSTVDTIAHTVTGTTTHFSGFTPCGPSCGFGGLTAIVKAYFVPVCCTVVSVGGSASATGEVNVANYTGGVGFRLANPPPGVTMSYAFGPQVGSSCAAVCSMPVTVTFTTTAATPLGQYNMDVEPIASGGAQATADFPIPVLVQAAPGFTLGTGSSSVALAQSSVTISTVTIARTNFTAPITLSAVNLPSGVTASFNPPQLTGATTTSTLTLTGSSTALAGTTNIIIRGAASGIANVDDTVSLTVASFAIAGTPASLSVAPGGVANTGVKVTRGNGFNGTITYAVTGLPTGLSANVTATAVADSSKFSVAASASLTPGSYPIVVTASSGSISQQVTIVVTVAPSGGGVTLDWSTCQFRPVWVAFQDGTGAWTHVTGAGDVYTLPTINSTAGGLAIVMPNQFGGFTTGVNFFTKAEFSLLPARCASASTTRNVSVAVAGITDTAQDLAWLSVGAASATATKNGTVIVPNVSSAAHDLVAYLQAPTGDRVTIQRNVSSGNINFSAALKPDSAMMTVNGISGTLMVAEMLYITNACEAGVMYTTNPSVSPFPYTGVPASLQAASDMHAFQITDFGASSFRSITAYFHSVANNIVTLPAAISPVFSTNTAPYERLQAVFPLPSDYINVDLQLTSATNHSVSVVAQTGGYIGSASVTLGMPDFSAVAGFNTAWELQAADAPTYLLEATALSPFTAPTCAAGTGNKRAYLIGSPP